MAQHVIVVTPERFASGLSYREFLAQAKVNQDRFQEIHRGNQGSRSLTRGEPEGAGH